MIEFFSKVSKREKIGLSIAAVIVAVTFLDTLVIKPIRTNMSRMGRQIELYEGELMRDLQSLNEKKAITLEYQKYTQYVTKAGSEEEEVAKILAEIEELARKSSVNLVDITPQVSRDVDFYKEYIIQKLRIILIDIRFNGLVV